LKRLPDRVALNRALSKLGILSRAQATLAIRAGRVRVGGHVVRDPAHLVVPERADIAVDGELRRRRAWRTILFHKPRGVVTTRRDPEGRRTIYDVIGEEGRGLIAVGRLDRATSGLLLMTSDTQLAHWITDPANAVPRIYVVTVRGALTESDVVQVLTAGVVSGRERLRAENVAILKASGRESHLTVELHEGKYREVRRLFDAIGHEVTRLKRVTLGGVELGSLEPGRWRELSREDVGAAFPGYGAGVTQPFRAAPASTLLIAARSPDRLKGS
jgi:23S rRNA pseudouridine2605 synthase